ncbi:45232_t:CDS:2, partial [Gigaspora margarita]
TSYIRAEILDGVDTSQIHIRLFDLAPNSDSLDNIKSYLHDTSKWTDK